MIIIVNKERRYTQQVGNGADADANLRHDCRDDFAAILTGAKGRDGGRLTSHRLSNSADLKTLNDTIRLIALTAAPTLTWTDDDTWRAVEAVATSVPHDDLSRPGVLAVQILGGFRDEPEPDEPIPGDQHGRTWANLLEKVRLQGKPDRDLRFANTLKLRRLFAAPIFQGDTERHFEPERPTFKKMAAEFLTDLFAYVRAEAARRAAESIDVVPPGLEKATTPPQTQTHAGDALPEVEDLRGGGPLYPLVETKARPRLRGIWRSRRSWILAGGAGLIVAVTIAVLALMTLQPESSVSTSTHTYLPRDSPVAAGEVGDTALNMTCAQRSYSSARLDARLCTEALLVLDPCFVDGSEVVCPSASDVMAGSSSSSGIRATIAEELDVDWMPGGQVGVEQAAQTKYPWAFELDLRDDDGQTYLCQSVPVGTGRFEQATFSCSSTGAKTSVMVADRASFIDGKGWVSVDPEGAILASDFQRTDPQWSVLVQLPGTQELERVSIAQAWF